MYLPVVEQLPRGPAARDFIEVRGVALVAELRVGSTFNGHALSICLAESDKAPPSMDQRIGKPWKGVRASQAKTVGSFLYWRPLTVLVRPMMVLTCEQRRLRRLQCCLDRQCTFEKPRIARKGAKGVV